MEAILARTVLLQQNLGSWQRVQQAANVAAQLFDLWHD
jgi:hypothetical protein